ncbi:hypothetical protein VSS74_14605 [Conexibacter stalactiti]|uniref:DUF5667 domain-containing protein n=1 Tax=Conexibacter stalactiti TaxID=1940611 RepID=A0ABU4HQI4_9ACTN|nr:hypothetical protein [Conexibacter stalactiti]MDW5595578.1 hypothetical protein [Conexibacter stalactiti]MEC5036220.1 hypothetical protein [Conexibacter stalactiti]
MDLKAWFARQTATGQAVFVVGGMVLLLACASIVLGGRADSDDAEADAGPATAHVAGIASQSTPADFSYAADQFVDAVGRCASLLHAGQSEDGAECVDDAFGAIEAATATDEQSTAGAAACRRTVGRLNASARALHESLTRMRDLGPGAPEIPRLDAEVRGERDTFALLSDSVLVDCAPAAS